MATAGQMEDPNAPGGAPATTPPEVSAEFHPPSGDSSASMALPPDSSLDSISTAHPLGELFAKLWAAKGGESRVEVHLNSGGILLLDGFVKTLSQQDHAVLVTKEPDESYTLTIVPWDAVARVILRGVKQVPGEIVR